MTEKKRCYVVMPFSQTSDRHTENYWTNHFINFLKPLIESSSLFVANRSLPVRGDIIKQIITDLIVSPVVVADLTELNPNVFWELGVRQSFKHGTITIAQEGTKLPFDISSKGTLFYCDSHIGNEEFIETFNIALNSCSSEKITPDSAVLDSVVGRGSLFELIHQSELLRRLDAIILENKINTTLFKTILLKCGENKGKKEDAQKNWTTDRFLFSSTELLLTNRYIDGNEQFYEKNIHHFRMLQAFNEALRNWYSYSERAEEWFSSRVSWFSRFSDYDKLLSETKKELSDRMEGIII
jgi:hypothetical protein